MFLCLPLSVPQLDLARFGFVKVRQGREWCQMSDLVWCGPHNLVPFPEKMHEIVG